MANEIKVLGVVLDQRLAFNKHVLAVTRSCNFHAKAIRHLRHLLSTDLAHTLACSLILTRLDYCNSVLYDAPVSSIQKLQCVQNNAARIVFQDRAYERSGAAKIPAHRSAAFTGYPLTAPFPFRRPPAPAPLRSAPLKSVFGPLRSVFRSAHAPLTCSAPGTEAVPCQTADASTTGSTQN